MSRLRTQKRGSNADKCMSVFLRMRKMQVGFKTKTERLLRLL